MFLCKESLVLENFKDTIEYGFVPYLSGDRMKLRVVAGLNFKDYGKMMVPMADLFKLQMVSKIFFFVK